MHRLPSHSVLNRFRFASLFVLIMFLCAPVTLGFLGYGFVSGRHEWFSHAAIVVGVGLACMLLNFILGSRLRCPLCMVPPLLNRHCSKHKNASTILGSHRLSVAHSILFKDNFRCPYCGESTAMVVRDRVRR